MLEMSAETLMINIVFINWILCDQSQNFDKNTRKSYDDAVVGNSKQSSKQFVFFEKSIVEVAIKKKD